MASTKNSPIKGEYRYVLTVIIASARRLLNVLVLAFALMGFIAVPIFDKTGLEHAREFLKSESAKSAKESAQAGFDRVRARIESEQATRDEQQSHTNEGTDGPQVNRVEERALASQSKTFHSK